jgi:site-specific recombinase XerD
MHTDFAGAMRKGIDPAPTSRDRAFHCQKAEYADHSIDRATAEKRLTLEDAQLIRAFISELKATKGISTGRGNKIIFTLITWRRYLPPFRTASITDLYQGINKLKDARIQGRPYKQNTQRDFLNFIKRFFLWMIKHQYSLLMKDDIREIKVPRTDTMTKTAEMMLSEDEVHKMIDACMSSRDRALLAMLYEGGFRIEEIGTMTWGQIKVDDYGMIVNTNKKTEKPRYVRLVSSTPFFAQWKNDYPYAISSEGLVFTSHKRLPLRYEGIALQLKKIAARAGVRKRITPHLFRHSKITSMVREGYNETIIKKMMWGNIRTGMFETYCHLTDTDVDDEVLSKQGIRRKDEKKQRAMEARQCPHCSTVNAPTDEYCRTCAKPLTAEIDLSMEEIKREIEKTPEFAKIMEMIRQNLSVAG